MKTETRNLIRNCRKLKKVHKIAKKCVSLNDLQFSLKIFETNLDRLGKRVPEDPRAGRAFRKYQAFYNRKCAEVYR